MGYNRYIIRYNLKFSSLDPCSLSSTAGSTAGWWLWTFELMVNTVYNLLYFIDEEILTLLLYYCTEMMKWSHGFIPHHVFMFSGTIMGLVCFFTWNWKVFFSYSHLQVTPKWKILTISQQTQWPSKIKTDTQTHILTFYTSERCYLGLSQLSLVFFKKGHW